MATREEEIKVKVTGDQQAERALDRVAGAADNVGDSVTDMGKDADKASRKVDDLGDEAATTASKLSRLQREVLEAKVALKALGDELERTGDAKVAEQFDKQASALGKLEQRAKAVAKINKDLAPKRKTLAERLIEDADERHGSSLFGKVGGAFSSIGGGLAQVGGSLSGAAGPIGTGALVAAGVASTLPAFAIAGGGVLAGGALGAVGGGIAGAAMQSEMVREEWSKTTASIKAEFLAATSSWVPATLGAIKEVGGAVKDIPLRQIFAGAEKYVEPLSKGIAGLIRNAGSGLSDFVRDAEPVVDKLSKKLPELGNKLGDSLEIIGEGAEGGAEALGDVLDIAGSLVQAFAGAAAGAGQLYDKLSDAPVTGWGHDLFMKMFDMEDLPEQAARKIDGVAGSTDDLASSAKDAKTAVEDLNAAFDKEFNAVYDGVAANLELKKAQMDLQDGWVKSKDALNASTEAGQNNLNLALEYIRAAKDVRDAAIAAGDGTEVSAAKANAAFQSQLGELEKMLVKLGMSKEAAHAFIEQFMAIDGKTVTTNIVTRHYEEYLPPGVSLGNLMHHAVGGTMMTSGPKLVGERGPELIWGSQGQYVSTNNETRALMSAAGRQPIGAGTPQIQMPPMSVIEQALVAVVYRLMLDGQLSVPSAAVEA